VNYLLAFRDPRALDVAQSGGKGANLAFLSQHGLPVPQGHVVSTAAWREYAATSVLPAGLADEIRSVIAPGRAFAVRSSSTGEDQATSSFAGQHDTFLNVVGPEAVLEKILACYRSLFSDRASAYRRSRKLDSRDAAMAVVLQPMAECDRAGVAFTLDPVSGDLGVVVIDANYGLGESVVSGEAEVDHYVVDRSTRALRSSRIAAKTHQVVPAAGGGTRHQGLASEESRRSCLSERELSTLVDLCLQVEGAYGFPQDIEWGIAGGSLVLLQSRAITSIPPRWTRDESAERFPNVVTPLTWDFLEEGFHRSLRHSLGLLGFPPLEGQWFALHGHYVYGNQNAVELYGRKATLTLQSLDDLRSAIPMLAARYGWIRELPAAWTRDLDHYLVRIGGYLQEPLGPKSERELWDFIRGVSDHGADYFRPNIAISIVHSSICRLLHRIVLLAVGASEGPRLFQDLLGFCETKTGQINRELYELAAHVRSDPALAILMSRVDSRRILGEELLREFPAFQERFAKLLRDHGHRELDFDLYVPTWIEAPWTVLDSIKLILRSPAERSPSEREDALRLRMRRADAELFRHLPSDVEYFAAEVLRLARVYTSLDDIEHYQTTRLALPMRKGLRALGERLAAKGVLDEPMDLFFARREQVGTAIEMDSPAGWTSLAEAVRLEKQAYLQDRERRPEWVLGETKEVVRGEGLAGLPGSPGEAEGPVCIVRGPEDFASFPAGSILVTRTTNPSWTPLFYSAAAVVTESGGPLSHGAVTAREMRIPAVMAVPESMSRLKNGDRVRVDGSRGKVYRLP
jgi:pyruvate,water dikinase